MRVSKEINLTLLEEELKTAGIIVNGLGMNGNEIFTYDEHGSINELPESAQAIIDLHEYTSEPQMPTIEQQLAEKDAQILKLKEEQFMTQKMTTQNAETQQELIELLMDMGVI